MNQSLLLAANRNTITLIIIIISSIIVFLFFLLRLLIKTYSKKNAEWNKDPKRPTILKDLKTIAEQFDLTEKEKNLLWSYLYSKKTPNFYINSKNDSFVDNLFKEIFKEITNEEKKEMLFSIRTKIEQAHKNINVITNTKSLLNNQKISILDEDTQYSSIIINNTQEGLIAKVPSDIYGNFIKKTALSKIVFNFETKNNVAYSVSSRIIRYQENQTKEMVIAHTSNIVLLHNRTNKRLQLSLPCHFSSVKVSSSGIGDHPKIQYAPMENKYEGILIDISNEGCCISTNLPIREDQYIYIELSFDGKEINSMIGIIVDSEKIQNSNLIKLHIRFVKIPLKTKNYIYSKIFDYI